LKLLLDENLSLAVCVFVRCLGHDAIGVAELGHAGASDPEFFALAREQRRVLVTLDADFANILRFPPKSTYGIIRLKVHPAVDELIIKQLRLSLQMLADLDLTGRLAVAEGSKVRTRG